MRKIAFAVLFLFVASVVIFAGAQQEKSAVSSGPVTVRVLENQDRFNINTKIFAALEQKIPGIKMEYLQQPQGGSNATHDKLVTMLAAKDGSIDVFSIDVIWPPELAAAGWLVPLNDVFPAADQKQHVSAMIDALTINGNIYGVPWLNDIGHMFYRKDMLDKAGIKAPEYWQELVEISQKLQSPELIGYVACFFSDQQLMCNYMEYLYGNGGAFLDETGKKILFTEKPSIEAVQFMVDLVNKYKIVQPGITTMNLDEGRVIFTQGRSVFHRNWNYVWANAQSANDTKVKGLIGTSRVPHFKNGPGATTLGGWSFAVNAFSKNKAGAAKAAAFLGGPEAQKIRALESERTPTILSLLSDPDVLKKYPVYRDWQAEADNARARPKSPFYIQMSDVFQRELQNAILMKKTPEQAMKDAADSIKVVIQ